MYILYSISHNGRNICKDQYRLTVVGGVSKGFLLVRQTQYPTQLQLQILLLFIPHHIIMVYFLHWHLEIYEAIELMDEWTNGLKGLLLP